MSKPYIYAVADERYWNIYGKAFLNSARAQGHEADVICLPLADTIHDKTRCATERFRRMPELVKKHGAVLALDVDAVVCKPIDVDDQYDVGLFLRNGPDRHKVTIGDIEVEVCARALAGIVYCASGGFGFADALASSLSSPDLRWGQDQAAIWDIYRRIGSQYRIKLFGKRHMDWEQPGACVYAAKGRSKASGAFLSAVEHWKKAC